ncbi:MAG: LysR family transcriptional regulator [Sandaracinaceae bacterium]
MGDLSWDDLRHVRAVAEAGSVRQGAATLGVSHQTVARHVARIERSLGVSLFIKSPAGYLLTPAAEEIVRTADAVEAMIGDTTRRVAGTDMRAAGTVRLTTIGWLIPSLCAGLAEFRRQYPSIVIELDAGSQIARLAQREADVAVRLARKPMGDLVGRKLAVSRAAIYAAHSYLEEMPRRAALEQHRWVGIDGAWAALRPGRWLAEHVPAERVVARSTVPSATRDLIRAGVGVGLLPCFVGDADPTLVRVRRAAIPELDVPVWLLTHPDLRRSARVRALMEFLHGHLTAQKARFSGRR